MTFKLSYLHDRYDASRVGSTLDAASHAEDRTNVVMVRVDQTRQSPDASRGRCRQEPVQSAAFLLARGFKAQSEL